MQAHWSHTVCVLRLQHASVFPPYPEQWKHGTELTRLFLGRFLRRVPSPWGRGEQADGTAHVQLGRALTWALAVRPGSLGLRGWGQPAGSGASLLPFTFLESLAPRAPHSPSASLTSNVFSKMRLSRILGRRRQSVEPAAHTAHPRSQPGESLPFR